MMFRKLYFVTEQTDSSRQFRVTGVYTSVHDLVDHGLRVIEPGGGGFRVNLVKLDCRDDVLGSWTGPDFANLESDLQRFVSTGEFGVDELSALREALTAFAASAVN